MDAPRSQCAGVSPRWLLKGGSGAGLPFASAALSVLCRLLSAPHPMSSQPWNQNLLLYVVSRKLAATSLRLLLPVCAVASPSGPLSSDRIGLSVVGEMNES